MIVHLLEQAGVHAHVEGEHLQSGAGELPLGNLVAVAVADDDVTTAREIIREWEARTAPAETAPGASAKSPALGQGISFLVGALLAGGIVWSMHNGPQTAADHRDHNGDGKPDDWAFYGGGRLERVEMDRNFDGRVDALTEYDASGLPTLYRADDTFDGTMDTTIGYRRGQAEATEVDTDGDGKVDYRMLLEHGVPSTAEYLNPATGQVKKKVTYVRNKADRVYLDLDEDGAWDRSYGLDAIDEPIYGQ